MAYRAALERLCTVYRTPGSNPGLSVLRYATNGMRFRYMQRTTTRQADYDLSWFPTTLRGIQFRVPSSIKFLHNNFINFNKIGRFQTGL